MLSLLRNIFFYPRDSQQLFNAGAQNVEPNHASTTTTLERDLVDNLTALMCPIIMEHTPLVHVHVHHPTTSAIKGPEGKRLISALKKFIQEYVRAVSQSGYRDSDEWSQGKADTKSTDTEIEFLPSVDRFSIENVPKNYGETKMVIAIPAVVPPTELETMTLKLTHAHVFNNMPIRLLSFDPSGLNLQLIERDEIFRRILPKVQAETARPEFEREWITALMLRDISFSMGQTGQNRRVDFELITAAIGRCSHYAILSHTWIRESPGDVVFSNWKDRASNPHGYAKIVNFCRIATRDHGMTLGWLDTVCINKDSSSELDESIRSMYRWYRSSHVCITYLSETERLDDHSHDSWFTRGWTLQELLAPTRLFFHNKNWERLGSTGDDSVQSLIEAETTITRRELDLCQQGKVDDIPLSRRMQMASRRQVTREEDSSYSLLGLLNVDISVAYGEGAGRAFHRLFRELLATKKHVLDLFNRTYFHGDSLIPPSISRYSDRYDLFRATNGEKGSDLHIPPEPVVVTHLGVRIQCLLVPSLCCESREDTSYEPKGDFSGQQNTMLTLKSGEVRRFYYNMLDRRLYLFPLPTLPIMDMIPIQMALQTFAVLNIDIKDDAVVLPEWCISVRMYTNDKPGTVGPSSGVKILSSNCPSVFQLTAPLSTKTIPTHMVKKHGMQLVTLYL